MSSRTRKKTRHNEGRKPFYKEHRRLLLPDQSGAPSLATAAEQILARPAYMNGLLLNRGLTWAEQDSVRLRVLAESASDIERSSLALGRPATALAWRAYDEGLTLPPEWAKLIRPICVRRAPQEPLLCYPYVKKVRPENADLLRANSLIPRGLPEAIRADVVQEMMLALYEGKVSMESLEKHSKSVQWFIAKFYREQRPYHEVSLEGRFDDDRSYEEIAAAGKADWAWGETNDSRRALDTYATHTMASQVDEVYQNEVSAAHSRLYRRGTLVSREETEEILKSDFDWTIENGQHGPSEYLSHTIERINERYGLDLERKDLRPIRDACQRGKPTRVMTDEDEVHFIRVLGVSLPCVYSRKQNHLRSVMPPGVVNRDGFFEFSHDDTYGDPKFREGRVRSG